MSSQITNIETLADMKAFLETLSPEQLQQKVLVGQDEQPSIYLKHAFVLHEDLLWTDNDVDTIMGRSDFENEDQLSDDEKANYVVYDPVGSVGFSGE